MSGMERELALTTLRAHKGDLERLGVGHLYLFGSVARDEAGANSDVDLFFDYADPAFSLIELIDVQQRTSDWLGRATDVMTRDSLHPLLRDRIEQSALQVF